MSFLNKLFGKTEQVRQLSQVSELQQGDIIVLTDSFALPGNLRGQRFQVSAVNSYEYEFNTQLEWVLKGDTNIALFLTLIEDDESYLKFSLKIEHQDVATLFNLDDFAIIFEEEPARLTKQADTQLTQGWTSEQYFQNIFAQVGFFHRKDHRVDMLSEFAGKDAGEQFELYSLLNHEETRGIDVEVWYDGDTDVFLTFYRPLSDIIDMFPGS